MAYDLSHIQQHEDRIKDIFDLLKNYIDDPIIQAHWSRYLCILVSGYIEMSVRIIFNIYTQEKAAPNVLNFVESQLNSFQNAKMGKIIEITRSFNQQWADTMEDLTKGELSDAINSIVANRHNIAHGRSSNVSYNLIKDWFYKSVKVINIIETIVLNLKINQNGGIPTIPFKNHTS